MKWPMVNAAWVWIQRHHITKKDFIITIVITFTKVWSPLCSEFLVQLMPVKGKRKIRQVKAIYNAKRAKSWQLSSGFLPISQSGTNSQPRLARFDWQVGSSSSFYPEEGGKARPFPICVIRKSVWEGFIKNCTIVKITDHYFPRIENDYPVAVHYGAQSVSYRYYGAGSEMLTQCSLNQGVSSKKCLIFF